MGSLNQHITPTGYRLGGTPVNSNPFWDDGGSESKNITATASVDNTTGTPAVEVTKTETTEAVNFDFAFTGLKGEQGEKGDDGNTPDVSASAVVTDIGSIPSVSVINVGTTEAPNFEFTFDHIGGGGSTPSVIPGTEFIPTFESPVSSLSDMIIPLASNMLEKAFALSDEANYYSWIYNFTGTIASEARCGANGTIYLEEKQIGDDRPYNPGSDTLSLSGNAIVVKYDNSIVPADFFTTSDYKSTAMFTYPNVNVRDCLFNIALVKRTTGIDFELQLSIKGRDNVSYPNDLDGFFFELSILGVTLSAHQIPPGIVKLVVTGSTTPGSYTSRSYDCRLLRYIGEDAEIYGTNTIKYVVGYEDVRCLTSPSSSAPEDTFYSDFEKLIENLHPTEITHMKVPDVFTN